MGEFCQSKTAPEIMMAMDDVATLATNHQIADGRFVPSGFFHNFEGSLIATLEVFHLRHLSRYAVTGSAAPQ